MANRVHDRLAVAERIAYVMLCRKDDPMRLLSSFWDVDAVLTQADFVDALVVTQTLIGTLSTLSSQCGCRRRYMPYVAFSVQVRVLPFQGPVNWPLKPWLGQ